MFFANEWLQSSVRSSGENIYRSPAQGIVTPQNKLWCKSRRKGFVLLDSVQIWSCDHLLRVGERSCLTVLNVTGWVHNKVAQRPCMWCLGHRCAWDKALTLSCGAGTGGEASDQTQHPNPCFLYSFSPGLSPFLTGGRKIFPTFLAATGPLSRLGLSDSTKLQTQLWRLEVKRKY